MTHVGGVYDDKRAAVERFIERYHALPDAAKRRLAVENDESCYSVADVLRISGRTGIRVIFDYLHHSCYDPEGSASAVLQLLARHVAGRPDAEDPTSAHRAPRMREQKRRSPGTGKMEPVYLPPCLRSTRTTRTRSSSRCSWRRLRDSGTSM